MALHFRQSFVSHQIGGPFTALLYLRVKSATCLRTGFHTGCPALWMSHKANGKSVCISIYLYLFIHFIQRNKPKRKTAQCCGAGVKICRPHTTYQKAFANEICLPEGSVLCKSSWQKSSPDTISNINKLKSTIEWSQIKPPSATDEEKKKTGDRAPLVGISSFSSTCY